MLFASLHKDAYIGMYTIVTILWIILQNSQTKKLEILAFINGSNYFTHRIFVLVRGWPETVNNGYTCTSIFGGDRVRAQTTGLTCKEILV